MKVKTVQRIGIAVTILTIIGWVVFVLLATYYIKSGEFRKDITQAGIATKQVIKDVKEAE